MLHRVRLPLAAAGDFDPAQTLDCGQAFRFTPTADGWWEGVAGQRYCKVRGQGAAIEVDCFCGGGCAAHWGDYFDAGRDYGTLKQEYSTDPVLEKAVRHGAGIRLLHQDTWETLCSFIISQNNHIARIKGIIRTLCDSFGPPIPGSGMRGFPAPETLAALPVDSWDVLRAGFRVKYLRDAAEKVSRGQLDLAGLRALPLEDARQALMQIYGVGPKVADCTLLFGCARMECFPRDVWIKRVLAEYYPGGFPERFAGTAGIAQQYLFHYGRGALVEK